MNFLLLFRSPIYVHLTFVKSYRAHRVKTGNIYHHVTGIRVV